MMQDVHQFPVRFTCVCLCKPNAFLTWTGSRFNMNMSYLYRKFHCGDETIVIAHNCVSDTGKMASLYRINSQQIVWTQLHSNQKYLLFNLDKIAFPSRLMFYFWMEIGNGKTKHHIIRLRKKSTGVLGKDNTMWFNCDWTVIVLC